MSEAIERQDLEDALKKARISAIREAVARLNKVIKSQQPDMTREGQALSMLRRFSVDYAIRRAALNARISCRDQILALIGEDAKPEEADPPKWVGLDFGSGDISTECKVEFQPDGSIKILEVRKVSEGS